MAILAVVLTLGLAVWIWTTFYLSWLFGFNQITILTSLALVLTGAVIAVKKLKPKLSFNWWLLANLVFWATWFGLVFTQMLKIEPGGLYAGWINVWGDWASHLSYTTSFAYGDNFPPAMPILADSRFGYPFLADFFPAMLVKLGAGLIPSMLITSWLWAVILTFWLMELGTLLTGKVKTGILTAYLFLFGGGLGWLWFFRGFNFNQEYTHLKIANIEWINIITSQIIPQRGFVMGFAIALMVYWLILRKKLIAAAIALALLPLVQAHALVIPAAFAFFLMVGGVVKSKNWLWFWLITLGLTLPQLIYFYGQSEGAINFVRLQLGWMAKVDNPLWFWLKNVGVFWPLILIGLIYAQKKLKLLSLPFWLIFIGANLFLWHPWEWDNSKLLTHWFFMAAVLAAVALEKGLTHKLWLVKLIGLIALAATIGSGVLDNLYLINYPQRKIRLVKTADIFLSEWVKQNTPPDSLFLTADNHDHWLPVLTGRKIMLGFKGWLWTYGLNYSRQEAAVNDIWRGGDLAAELLSQYGVDYVVIGPAEKASVNKLNQAWFNNNLATVYQSEETTIYSGKADR